MEQDYSIRGALMPDAHTGYGLPIGGVVETEGVILPSWVGYDIGCGMCAMPIEVAPVTIVENDRAIFDAIYRHVPTGFNVHQHPKSEPLDPADLSALGQEMFKKRKGFRSIGTLGGGNHFIEIGFDVQTQMVWIIIHSGSRGVGHGIAGAYMEIAGGVPGKKPEGHWPLSLDSTAGQDYIQDMMWATEFALANRHEIMLEVIAAINEVLGEEILSASDMFINRNHNHADPQPSGTWIHRKGATHAEYGMDGVIPGNMRDGSFIVKGLGNKESLQSSSHGAGRVLGRKRAKRELNVDEFVDTMQGIVAKVGPETLDESPAAYKNIFDVMDLQQDLVVIQAHILPLINVKA